MYSDAGVKHVSLKALGPGMTNVMIVGTIIAKQNPRMVKKAGGPSEDRGVFSFTLRDSPYDFINVSCWGGENFLNGLANKFHIGEVVDIINPKVTLRQAGEQDTRFRPSVTSPFQLTMSENQSRITHHEGDDVPEYLSLLKLPTKPASDFFTLADIHTNGASMHSETVDLLTVVRSVGPVRSISAKDGRRLITREVVVFDQTSNGLTIQLWCIDIVNRADHWRPRETVLFLADMRVEWNMYKRSIMASDGNRTVVTENPDTPQAVALLRYARTAPIQATAILDHLANSLPDPSSIRQVMTVQQLLDRAMDRSQDDAQFTALIYCLINNLNLDGCSRVIVSRCSGCQLPLEDENSCCVNLECPIGSGARTPMVDTSFDLRVTLVDHTGSLENCRLIGSAAERVLNCSLDEFMAMSLDAKTQLKWQLLLQRCAARVMVLRPSSDNPRPLVSLLACSLAEPSQLTSCIPIY
ncbi:meiosis-specific with OB domain-containing protein [Anabrus simplex]|uniref:meiosis-specific with OB domain-containing protein n=1 Tax=Anabrus simplex TaxID=316456 RepID=UPI0035A2D989